MEESKSDKLDLDRHWPPHQSKYLLVWRDWNTIHPINHILFFNWPLWLTNEWSVKTGRNYILEIWEILWKLTVKKQRGGRDDPREGGGCCGWENGRAAPQDFPTRFFCIYIYIRIQNFGLLVSNENELKRSSAIEKTILWQTISVSGAEALLAFWGDFKITMRIVKKRVAKPE